jgi:mitochondrial fission protein ELM1
MIPKHDRVPERDNIITTTGALNPIQFNNNKSLDLGLILLGGPSRHYDWNDHAIMSQVGEIVSSSPDIRWMVADSPRTPETMVESLRNQPYKNLDILDYSKTSTAELHKLIYNAAFIWVTKDSVTMVYEALSSGASVALIDLKARNDSKISSAVNSLIAEKKVGAFSDWQKNHELTASTVKFNEAERCAELLLKRKTLE